VTSSARSVSADQLSLWTSAALRPDPSMIAAADAFLVAALRDDAGLPELTEAAFDQVLPRALHHGVAALLVARPDVLARLPGEVRSPLQSQARAEAMWELRHRHVIVPVIEAFAAAGIPAIVLKGTALAYSLYPSPALRQRGDTDILFPKGRAEAVRRILQTHGFKRSRDSKIGAGTEAIRQELWSSQAADGTEHAIDVHWGVMNAWSLAGLFESDEVISRAEPLPRLSPLARRIGNADALYHACVHRGVHIRSPYYVGADALSGGDRLIWLHDIHLIVATLGDDDWREITARAVRDGTADLCLDALKGARQRLGSSVPSQVLEELESRVVSDGPSVYLARASFGQRLRADLSAVPGLVGKIAFLRSVLFPARDYMAAKYPDMARSPVALLHLRRLRDRLRRARHRPS
jgi:hypothetical protein